MTDDRSFTTATNHLSRRAFLASSSVTVLSVAGCIGDGDSDNDDEETPSPPETIEGSNAPSVPRVSDPPAAVYVPTHRNAMQHKPTIETGEYALTPMVTYPHKFWLVTGQERQTVDPTVSGVHMMATVWDSQTGSVLPVDMGTQMRVFQDGDRIDRRAPWPMISQRMGFHFGDNVPLPERGTYTVEVELNPIETRTTGEFAGRFEEAETATFEFAFDEEFQQTVVEGVEYFDEDRWGRRDALQPMGMGDGMDGEDDGMDMMMPYSDLKPATEYPGTGLGTPTSGDATFVVRYLSESRLADGDSGYLLVSPRTPYNRVPLADMALSVSGAIEGELVQTLDSELGHHYGHEAALGPGDTVEIEIESPPQVARHRGYETAFLDMPPVTVEMQ